MSLAGWLGKLRGKKTESRFPVGTSSVRGRIYSGEASAFRNSAFWSCVTLLCSYYATLPFVPHEEKSYQAMGKSRLLYHLLESPNPFMNQYDFMYVMGLNFELYGKAYAVLEKKNGFVIGMYPVSPSLVNPHWEGSEIIYTVYGENGSASYHRDDLLVITNTPSGYTSVLSPLENSRQGLELAEKAKEMQAEYYEGGTVLGRVIKVQDRLYDTQREQIKEMMDNQGNFRNLILPQSVEIDNLKTEGDNLAKLIEAQSWDVSEVSRRFHIPKAYLGDTSGGYGSVEQQGIQLVQQCLYPRCKCWEMAFNADVCQEGEYVKFDLQSLMRGDHASRQSWYQTMLTHGVYSVNEVRGFEDLAPLGKEGDKHYFQSGFATLESIGKEETPKKEESFRDMAHRYGVYDEEWIRKYEDARAKREPSEDEPYRALNSVLVKKFTLEGRKYTANGESPVNGYFWHEGKKYRNPPFFPGDTTIVEAVDGDC